jgi:plastocyanin
MTPITRAAVVAIFCCSVSSVRAATIEGVVTVGGRPAPSAVVYLEQPAPALPTTPPPRAVMDQKNLTFVPSVLPVRRGTIVAFTNGDDVQHNVFSPSATAHKFDLGTYGPGAVRTIILDEPGEVLVLCNIHMEMEAHILVLDGPYFTTAAGDGSYQIPAVPAGPYTVKIWHRRWLPFAQTVDVPAAGNFTFNIAVGK